MFFLIFLIPTALLTNQKVTKKFWREIMLICEWQKAFPLTVWIQYIISWHFRLLIYKTTKAFFENVSSVVSDSWCQIGGVRL